MRSRTQSLVEDHFRVDAAFTEDLLVWEACTADPFQDQTLVAPVFTRDMTEVTEDQLLDPLTRVKLR